MAAIGDLTSPSPSSPCPTKPQTFHVPGPSSRFNRREKTRPLHTRWKSTYTPVAPVLSTESRAHRRTRSVAQVATVTAAGVLTPPATATSASESSRSPLSRFSSYTDHSKNMTTTAPTPVTPAKQMDVRLQDSPFSDYFTDDARSVEHSHVPSSETQQLLVRLNRLQALLMRSSDAEQEALNIVGRKMSEIDSELDALHSQTRLPAELEDAGLFLDDDEAEEDNASKDDTHVEDFAAEPKVTAIEKAAEFDFQLVEAQRVLAKVLSAQEQLRLRHAELRQLNDAHIMQITQCEQEVEQCRAENEALKSDLGFDHTELLFLNLQFQALEVEFDNLEDSTSNATEEDLRRVHRRGKLAEEMERWRIDWQDVDERMKKRRSKYGVLSANYLKERCLEKELEAKAGKHSDEWQLETVKEGQGRVSSITIRRLPNTEAERVDRAERDEQEPHVPAAVNAGHERMQDVAEVPSASIYAEQSTQTEPIFSPPYPPKPSDLEPFPPFRNDIELDGMDGDDCAITTSPTTRESSPIIRPLGKVGATQAWHDLWEGLANLAGGSFLDE